MGDWGAAEEEYKQVIALDANYKDVQTRLAEVRARLKVEVGALPNAGTPHRMELPGVVTCTWVQLDILEAKGPNIGISEIELWGW